ncbi:MBL fold metallo-hydrolase [Nonomuraea sp. NPDC049637]|uniref:MBL fold metallo-hydrolase n=1 Tax=Nonomuraea sp. NPDC049637 TaxID=3154356 RepID=UPI0034490A40
MFFTQYYLDCLSQASYMIADEGTGHAVVVDPRRDVSEYLADARAHGLTVVGVVNTHFHADFVAGHLELADDTGAWIGYGRRAETEYPIRKLGDGERVSLGDVTLEIMETPGHTPESISVLVYEHAEDPVPYGVLTGDALFIGDVGRPDLLASVGVTPGELGAMLYDSVQNKLMGLPDEVRVFPAHGAGSACGKNLSAEKRSTIGEQRATNYACVNVPADGRFAEQAGTVLDPAAELVVMAPQNREEEVVTRLARIGFDRVAGYLRNPDDALVALAAEVAPASRLTAAQLRAALAGDAPPVVVDVRTAGEREANGFIDAALHIPLSELPARSGELPADRPLVLHCAGGHRSSVAASLLRHRGFQDVSDVLGGYAAWALSAEPAGV